MTCVGQPVMNPASYAHPPLACLIVREEALVLTKNHNRSLSLIVTYITQVDDEQLNC